MQTVRLSKKGQITLPASVRKRLGLADGALFSLHETADGWLLRQVGDIDLLIQREKEAVGAAVAEEYIAKEARIAAQRSDHLRREHHPEASGS
ncbi:MAG TPA: AbrB/MazE/SpoVT family DNA-binding domain-containing protein [Armatimonadota bacterium]|jgi:AbrB family looped-hinge helix DNA binding protein